MERIKAYFEEQIKTDPALAEAYKEEKLRKCWQYIMSQAKKEAKNNCAMIEEAQVYKWARDFMLGDVPEAKEEIQTGAPAEDNNSVTSEEETIEEGTAEEVAAGEPEEVSEKAPVINGKEIAEGTYEITPDLHFNDVPKNEKLVIEKVEEEPAEVMQSVIQKEKKSKKADEYDGPSLFDFDDLF